MSKLRSRRSTFLSFQPPAIGEEEIEAVAETLRSGWLTTGPKAALLEERMAEYLEADHVVAVASGTAAMHLALVALGVGPGDEVVTTPITWPATANVIVHSGATPVFVDVRPTDLNIDPELVGAAVTDLRLMRRGDGSLYDITVPGYKANLSDVLAAIALVQLDKLPVHTARRLRQFALYDEGLAEIGG